MRSILRFISDGIKGIERVDLMIDPTYTSTEPSMRLLAFGLVMLLLGRWWAAARAKRDANESQPARFLEAFSRLLKRARQAFELVVSP